jgi:putative ABC transport system substrate-binding protein
MTTRRALLLAVVAIPLLARRAAWAQKQTAKIARIGWLSGSSKTDDVERLNAFREALRTLGHVEGRNIAIEGRWADGRYERIDALAAELIRLPVDVLVTYGTPTTQAAKRATSTIPIVMASVAGDPVASGLVASLAHPGGNVTGTTSVSGDVSAKWLDLLREGVPRIRRVAYVRNADTKTATAAAMHAAAKSLKLEVREFPIKRADELEGVFAAMAAAGIDAVTVQPDSLLNTQTPVIVELAAKHRLPLAGGPSVAEAGGLIGYGAYRLEGYRGAATFVDKILKGAKPADLPVQQASRFRLVINARTAKTLGIAIPQTLLLRADRVIE